MNPSELIKILEPLLTEMGIDLVDLELHGGRSSGVVRVFVDEVGGISLARCTQASRAISALLDQEEPFQGQYRLEVSSPGIDRPLTTEKDFIRHRGRFIHITYRLDGADKEATGTIQDAGDQTLTLQSGEDVLLIPLDDIILAKIIIEL